MSTEGTELAKDIRDRNFAFVDLEMTGLHFEKHEILEIGLVLAKHKKDKNGTWSIEKNAEYEWKTKPLHIEEADPVALSVNKYKKEDWTDALSLRDALKEFSEKATDAILVGHNVAFDYSFLEKGFQTENVENKMHYHKLDTISLAYAMLFNSEAVKKFSLRELCSYFGIKNENAHTALSDARATFELYKKLLDLFKVE